MKEDNKKELVKHIKIFLRKKNKKNGEYGREPYKNISDEKRKLAEYKKNIL